MTKVGCLQFNPRLGEVQRNVNFVDRLLDEAETLPDLLVLPELAFTGYNFPTLEAIKPYLEPSGAGPTSQWAIERAKRHEIHIIVGYPETCVEDGVTRNYNATITIGPAGQVVASYRKSFLYYTDETWASEGPLGDCQQLIPQHVPFFYGNIPSLSASRVIGHGICMDINPYQFKARWDAYEFANCMLRYQVRLVVLSMAWLSGRLPQDLLVEPNEPDMETVAYWLERFRPFIQQTQGEDIVVIFANRCGTEGSMQNTENGSAHESNEQVDRSEEPPQQGNRVCYAGSSCVMKFQNGSARCYERSDGEVAIMGKSTEGLLVVDIESAARFRLQQS